MEMHAAFKVRYGHLFVFGIITHSGKVMYVCHR